MLIFRLQDPMEVTGNVNAFTLRFVLTLQYKEFLIVFLQALEKAKCTDNIRLLMTKVFVTDFNVGVFAVYFP